MTTRNHRIRLCANNYLKDLSASRVTYSSQLTAFPYSNCQLDLRPKVFKFAGRFTINSTNKNIYINDGSNKTVTLTESDYTTPALLAAHIQTKLNASSSNWSCTYSTTTFKFMITHTGAATLRLTQTTNAAWSTIGFTTTLDLVDVSFIADSQRNHTSESIVWDLGTASEGSFFAVIGKINEVFNISSTATLKLYANSINDFTSPPINETLTRSDNGIFHFLDGLASCIYRYWKFEIIDLNNPVGPNLSIAHIYLGNYLTFTDRDTGHGYSKAKIDPSIIQESEGGSLYFDTKSKYTAFNDIRFDILTRDNKDDLETLFNRVGRTIPFYCSVDPLNYYTDSIDELTKFVYFNSEPNFSHTFKDMFSTSIYLREAV